MPHMAAHAAFANCRTKRRREDTDVPIVRYTWVSGRKTNRTTQQLIPSAVSLRRAGVEQLYQVKRMIGGIGNMCVPALLRMSK